MIRSTTLALAFAAAASLHGAPLRAQHDMSNMGMDRPPALPLGIPFSRLGSGTSWLPDASRERMLHGRLGDWTVMVHGAAFGEYDRQWTLHGGRQWGVIDWEMLMAARSVAGGVLRFDAMTSLEPFFLPVRGYPELLQTGETYQGGRVANMQHPNELFMALAAAYDHSLTSKLASSVYVAAVGEPALGPVAYAHRPSAAPDPFAPIGHHWQDGSHVAFGVVTAGLYSRAVKLEGSAFNGREPDSYRFNLDYRGASLDSYSGRVTVAPGAHATFSGWAGYLADHDPLEPGLGMQRYGASLLTEGSGIRGGGLSTALIWGLNIHHHGARAHEHGVETPRLNHPASSVLIESTLGIGTRTDVYARAEQVQKMGDDLGFVGSDLTQMFTIQALSIGATRELREQAGIEFAAGARMTVNRIPESLVLAYQTRTPSGFSVFVRFRPGSR